MSGRYEPLLDDDAEAGCTKEQLLERLGILSQETADTGPAAAKTPESSGNASPTCVASGPYSSSEDSSPASTQMPTPSDVAPSPDGGPTAGQGPPDGNGTAGGEEDGCGSRRRRTSSSYYTAEPGSPLSEASFGSPLSEQTSFLSQNGGQGTSSGPGSVVPDSETSPIDTPSDVSNAGDSSDSDSQPSQRPQPRSVHIPLCKPSSRSGFNIVISSDRCGSHSTGDGDGSQPDIVSAPVSTAEPQERDPLITLCESVCDGLFRGELRDRVKVVLSSEEPPTGPAVPAPGSCPHNSGGSHSGGQWGAQNGDAGWRQPGPAMRGGFLKRRPEPARSSDVAPVPEALPPPPPMRAGFFGRRPAGESSSAKHLSEPQPQPQPQPQLDQHSTSRDYCQLQVECDGKMIRFKVTPQQASACGIACRPVGALRQGSRCMATCAGTVLSCRASVQDCGRSI